MSPVGQACNFKNANEVKLLVIRGMGELGYTFQRLQPKDSSGKQLNIMGFKNVTFVSEHTICSKFL